MAECEKCGGTGFYRSPMGFTVFCVQCREARYLNSGPWATPEEMAHVERAPIAAEMLQNVRVDQNAYPSPDEGCGLDFQWSRLDTAKLAGVVLLILSIAGGICYVAGRLVWWIWNG